MIDYVLHWLNNTHYLLLCLSIIIFFFILINPLAWIPFIIYCIYVTISMPSYFEIDIYRKIRNIIYAFIKPINILYKPADKFTIINGTNHIESLNKPAIYGFHPHGLASITRTLFCSNQATQLYQTQLKDAYHAAHSLLFKVPILRELLLLGGAIPVSESYIRHYLSKGHSITITPGGAREMKYTQDKYHKNGETYYLIPRKGIARIAEDMNIPMIPIYTEGERQLFSYNPPSLPLRLINSILEALIQKTTDVNVLQILYPSNIMKWHELYYNITPITTTYIGKPTYTYEEYTDQLKALCKEANVHVKEIQIK